MVSHTRRTRNSRSNISSSSRSPSFQRVTRSVRQSNKISTKSKAKNCTNDQGVDLEHPIDLTSSDDEYEEKMYVNKKKRNMKLDNIIHKEEKEKAKNKINLMSRNSFDESDGSDIDDIQKVITEPKSKVNESVKGDNQEINLGRNQQLSTPTKYIKAMAVSNNRNNRSNGNKKEVLSDFESSENSDEDITLNRHSQNQTMITDEYKFKQSKDAKFVHNPDQQMKQNLREEDHHSFEIIDDDVSEDESDKKVSNLSTSHANSFEIIDEEEEFKQNNNENGLINHNKSALNNVGSPQNHKTTEDSFTSENNNGDADGHDEDSHRYFPKRKGNKQLTTRFIQDEETYSDDDFTSEKIIDNSNQSIGKLANHKPSAIREYSDHFSFSNDAFVVPDDIDILSSSSSSSSFSMSDNDEPGHSDSHSVDFPRQFHGQSHTKKTVSKKNLDKKKLDVFDISNSEQKNNTFNEDNKINSLLDDMQDISSSKQAEFDNLSNSIKLSRLEQLVEKSKVFSQIIADTLLQSSLDRKKKLEESAIDVDNVQQKRDENENEKDIGASSRRKSSGSSRTKRTKKKKNDSGIISMYSENPTNITEETLKTKEKLTNLSSGTRAQPGLITGARLRDYQLDGLDWLITLYENGLNGILADEMGLGKTLQSISLLAFLYENNNKGPFLVACPLSTVGNWYREVTKFAPGIPCLQYTGLKEEREYIRSKHFTPKKRNQVGIVITSYETILRDRRYLEKFKWKFLIVDEGHRLKNINSKLIKELKKLKTENRLLITGTPLQNNLDELWSLLNFILPDIFQDIELFHQWFNFSPGLQEGVEDEILNSKIQAQLVENLHTILKPFILRRLKKVVIKSLPPKREYIIYCKLSCMQAQLYESALKKNFRALLPQIAFKEYISANRLQVPDEKVQEFIESKVFRIKPNEKIIDLHNDEELDAPVINKIRRSVRKVNYKESGFNQFEGDVTDQELSDVNVYKKNYYEKDDAYVEKNPLYSEKIKKRGNSDIDFENLPSKKIKLSQNEKALSYFRKINRDIPPELLNLFSLDVSLPQSTIGQIKKVKNLEKPNIGEKITYFMNYMMLDFVTLVDKDCYNTFISQDSKELSRYSDMYVDLCELYHSNNRLFKKSPNLKQLILQNRYTSDKIVIDCNLLESFYHKFTYSEGQMTKLMEFDPMSNKYINNKLIHEKSIVPLKTDEADLLKEQLEKDLFEEETQIRGILLNLKVHLDTVKQREEYLIAQYRKLIIKFNDSWKQFLLNCKQHELLDSLRCTSEEQKHKLTRAYEKMKSLKLEEFKNSCQRYENNIARALRLNNEEKSQVILRLHILSSYGQVECLDNNNIPDFNFVMQKYITPTVILNEKIVIEFAELCKKLLNKYQEKSNTATQINILMSKVALNGIKNDGLKEYKSNGSFSNEQVKKSDSLKIITGNRLSTIRSSGCDVSLNNQDKSSLKAMEEKNKSPTKKDASTNVNQFSIISNQPSETNLTRTDDNIGQLIEKQQKKYNNDGVSTIYDSAITINKNGGSASDKKLIHNDTVVLSNEVKPFVSNNSKTTKLSNDSKIAGDTKIKKQTIDQNAKDISNSKTTHSHSPQKDFDELSNSEDESSCKDILKISKKNVYTPEQNSKYDVILNKAWEDVSKDIKYKNYGNIMMQLRSLCDSPYMFFFPWIDEDNVSRNLIENSGKMQVLDQLLDKLLKDNHKVLIFSQFTTMLDLIEDYLAFKNLDRCRLDGNYSQPQRDKMIKKFYSDDNCMLFLLSTRAGGLGINLVAADTVIIFDSDWNPQVDLQAMDRAHRLGQTKPVIVYRFTTMDTIEQILLAKADTKRNLEKVVIQLGKFESLIKSGSTNMNSKDLQKFLKGNVFQVNDDVKDNKLSGEELHELLDRSDESYDPRTCVMDHLELFNTSKYIDDE